MPPDVMRRSQPREVRLSDSDPPGLRGNPEDRVAADCPQMVWLELARRCNIRCRTCLHPADGPLMSWETFELALCLVGRGTEVLFLGGGEALLHPDVVDAVAAVADRGGRSSVWTNGMLATPDMSAALRQAGLEHMVFSIHGARPETHERLQVGVDSAQVWGNVSAAVETGLPVRIVTIPMEVNIGELLELAEKAAASGVRDLSWLRFINPPDGMEGEDLFRSGAGSKNRLRLAEITRQIRAVAIGFNDDATAA